MPDASGVAVELISDFAAFAALREDWNALAQAAAARGSVFLCHEWFDAAWQWQPRGTRLHLLCLFVDRRLRAVLPLVSRRIRARGVAIRELAFLTVPDTQTCDLIVAESDRTAASAAFAAELRQRQRDWDVIRFKYLAPGSVAASALRAKLNGFVTRSIEAPGNPFIPLDADWTTYYATRSRRLKKSANLADNRLERAGRISIDWLQPDAAGAGVDSFVERAIAISGRSWKKRTGNSLDNAGPGAFIRRLSALAAQRGWLSIWILGIDDRPVAMEYQLVADGDVHGLRSDFDAGFETVSPGSCLNRHLIERLFGRGWRRYYLGPGDNAYKHRWADRVDPREALTVYGRTLVGRALAGWEITLKPLTVRLRDRLRKRESAPEDDAEP